MLRFEGCHNTSLSEKSSGVKKVTVYTKEGCHLCEGVIAQLEEMQRTSSFELSTEDITKDDLLFERFKNIIPVVAVDGAVRVAGASLSNQNSLRKVLEKALSGP